MIGAGGFLWGTNADNVGQLAGPSDTVQGGIGFGVDIGFSFSWSIGIWIATFAPPGLGAGIGAGFSHFKTTTYYCGS
jgi:hypothetical protein